MNSIENPASEPSQEEEEQSIPSESKTNHHMANLLQIEFIQETLEKPKVKLWRFRMK